MRVRVNGYVRKCVHVRVHVRVRVGLGTMEHMYVWTGRSASVYNCSLNVCVCVQMYGGWMCVCDSEQLSVGSSLVMEVMMQMH